MCAGRHQKRTRPSLSFQASPVSVPNYPSRSKFPTTAKSLTDREQHRHTTKFQWLQADIARIGTTTMTAFLSGITGPCSGANTRELYSLLTDYQCLRGGRCKVRSTEAKFFVLHAAHGGNSP